MKAENCRPWRHLLGAYALGQLSDEERPGLEAHLEGCAECREEAHSLGDIARLLPLADPARIANPVPQPAPGLGDRIAATVATERRQAKREQRRRKWSFGLAIGAATAATAAVLAILLVPSTATSPEQQVAFADLPAGVNITATLEPHPYGTEIYMYVSGVQSGTLCRVFLRARDGTRVPAGTFRYRYGSDSRATLSSALDLSRTKALGVRVGHQTFIAPVNSKGAIAFQQQRREDQT